MVRRKIHLILSKSTSCRTYIIIVLSLVIVSIFFVVAELSPCLNDNKATDSLGKDIVTLFINPGSLESYSDSSWASWAFAFVLAIVGYILFSVLLSSSITAWITNLNSDITEGRKRYNLSNHAVIFGGGDQLEGIISLLARDSKDVLVIAPKRPKVKYDNFIFYCGERDDESMIKAAQVNKASVIYIIGEDNETGHDSRSLKCLEMLKKSAGNSKEDKIHCYITFDDEETTEVFQYLKGDAGNLSSRLYLVDAINEYEYRSEQFVLNTDFIPVLKKDSTHRAHFILIGTGKVTQAMAYTLAHACHYPKLNGEIRKTCITIVAPDALNMRDTLILARPYLFQESVYESIGKDNIVEIHSPDRDILDIEWRFLEGSLADKHVNEHMRGWVNDESLDNRILVCNMKSSEAIPNALHLPAFIYGKIPIAVYLEDSAELIDNANKTLMYGGGISVFGSASDILSDPLMKHRSECGQRVNFIYELAYPSKGESLDTPIKAWYPRCEADKLSSIYCAIGLSLREKTFNIVTDIEEVYEAEHRRWMMSEYLMGFRYGLVKDKSLFIHNDLIPYEDLPKNEQIKDKILIDNRKYILTGEGNPV